MTTIKPEVLDELLSGVSSPEDLLGDAGLFKQLKKASDGASAWCRAERIISATRRATRLAGAAATAATAIPPRRC